LRDEANVLGLVKRHRKGGVFPGKLSKEKKQETEKRICRPLENSNRTC